MAITEGRASCSNKMEDDTLYFIIIKSYGAHIKNWSSERCFFRYLVQSDFNAISFYILCTKCI